MYEDRQGNNGESKLVKQLEEEL